MARGCGGRHVFGCEDGSEKDLSSYGEAVFGILWDFVGLKEMDVHVGDRS